MELFNASSSSVESRVFAVRPGFMAVISLYGFNTNYKLVKGKLYQTACLTLQRVRLQDSLIETQSGSCLDNMPVVTPAQIISATDLLICGKTFKLDACNNYKVLALPGVWRFILSDEAQLGAFTLSVDFMETSGITLPNDILS